jgi:hypothetical protein
MINSVLTDNKVIRYLVCNLPPRIKRLIYVSSLAATINENGTLNKEQYDDLNKLMLLASTGYSSMQLPALFSKYIWKNNIVKEQLEELKNSNNINTYSSQIKYIVSLTPDWIRYDSEIVIARDIETLFSKRENLI